MKKPLFLFILSFRILFIQAQENHFIPKPPPEKYISITTDLMQYTLIQPNIGIDFRRNDRIDYGINIGMVLPDPMFSVNGLADGQYKWPGTVYNGAALRLNFKYYRVKKPKSYWSPQLVAKYEWYNNVKFMDLPYGDIPFNYTMNEKCTVLGLDLLHGHQWGGPESNVDVDFFYGLGIRVRIRTFNVFDANYVYSGYLPEGTYSGYISYFTPVLGLKLGFKIRNKEAPTK